jgi:aconitate hydratase
LLSALDDIRQVTARVTGEGWLRAVISPFIPSGAVSLLAGLGVVALATDLASLPLLKGQRSLALPALSSERDGALTVVTASKSKVPCSWMAIGQERTWTLAGTSRPAVASASTSRARGT